MQEKFYDKIQHHPAESNASSSKKMQFLHKEIGSSMMVLDVGCYDGTIGKSLIDQGNIVYGVDVTTANLNKAKKKGLRVKKIAVTATRLPYGNNTFDVVLLGDVLEHVFDTDALLREARRVLKQGGKILIATPNVASFGRRCMLLCGISPYLEFSLELLTNGAVSVGHIRYYTKKTLEEQLKFNKFSEVKTIGDSLNLHFASLSFAGKYFPSLCTMLLCSAKKK